MKSAKMISSKLNLHFHFLIHSCKSTSIYLTEIRIQTASINRGSTQHFHSSLCLHFISTSTPHQDDRRSTRWWSATASALSASSSIYSVACSTWRTRNGLTTRTSVVQHSVLPYGFKFDAVASVGLPLMVFIPGFHLGSPLWSIEHGCHT